jgi:hypothetical protein
MEDDMTSEVKLVFDLSQGAWADLHKTGMPENPGATEWPLRDNVEWMGVDTTELQIGRLPGGIRETGGSPAVFFRANRRDGSVVLIETSLGVFLKAAEMLKELDVVEQQTTNVLKFTK